MGIRSKGQANQRLKLKVLEWIEFLFAIIMVSVLIGLKWIPDP